MTEHLVVTWDGGGNVPPALALAARLRDRGHGVRVLGHPSQREAVVGAGLDFVAYPTVRPFEATQAHSLPRLVAHFSDPRLGADVAAEVRRVPTDLVAVDCMLLPALKACATLGVPVVSLEHCFDGYLRRGWAGGPVGLAARLRGVAPARRWDAAAVCLVATLPSLDPGYDDTRPGNRVWTGPFVETPPARDWSARPDGPVLVSLSTFHYPGMREALQRVVDGLGLLGVPAVVTTGPVLDPADLRAPAGVEVHRFVPHDQLMPTASMVVGHGGHATTLRALAHDLPLLVVPLHPMLDQPMVGRRVEESGAGLVLPKKASPERVRDAVASLVGDGPHRRAAARLGAEIRAAGGVDRAVDLLEEVVPRSAPQHP